MANRINELAPIPLDKLGFIVRLHPLHQSVPFSQMTQSAETMASESGNPNLLHRAATFRRRSGKFSGGDWGPFPKPTAAQRRARGSNRGAARVLRHGDADRGHLGAQQVLPVARASFPALHDVAEGFLPEATFSEAIFARSRRGRRVASASIRPTHRDRCGSARPGPSIELRRLATGAHREQPASAHSWSGRR